jgi:hypothetical protein
MMDPTVAIAAASGGTLVTLLAWVVWLLLRLCRAIEAVARDPGPLAAQPVESGTDNRQAELPHMEPPASAGDSKAALWQRVAVPS